MSACIYNPSRTCRTANEYDPLFEDAPQSLENGDHSVEAGAEDQPHASENGTAPAPDLTAEPITDVSSGIAPIAPFSQDQPTSADSLLNPADVAVPTSLPPSIEQPVSDARDETISIPRAHAPDVTSATEPTGAAQIATAQGADAAESSFADLMDTSGDAAMSTDAADLRSGDSQTTHPLPTAEATTSSMFGGDEQSRDATKAESAGSTPVADTQCGANQEAEAPSSGKVRGREEDDESGPSAKRPKTVDAAPEFKVPERPAIPSASLTTGTSAPPPTPAADNTVPAVSYDSSPLNKLQRQYIMEKLRQAKKIQAARNFLHPVDPVALNIPRYPEIVKNPMDISTMEQKLKQDQYPSANAFMDDFNLMIQNCVAFNGPGHPVTVAGQNLKAYFDKLMSGLPKGGEPVAATTAKKAKKPTINTSAKASHPKRESRVSAAPAPPPAVTAISPSSTFALDPNGVPLIRRDSSTADGRPKREIHRPPPRDLPYSTAKPKKKKYQMELKFCQHVLDEMFKNRYRTFSYPFLVPVDPVALNIPQYHKIIKKPMDLGTIQTQLKAGFYTHAKEFHADVRLMFENCYKFNPETDDVHKMGKSLENLFKELWAEKDNWISDHAPASEPQSPATAYSDEEDESDEEDAEPVDETKTQLLAIQQQIAALNAQTQKILQKETATTRKSSPKPSGSKKSSKPPKSSTKPRRSGSGAGFTAKQPPKKKAKNPILTFDQKQEVSEGIQQLNEADMRKAVQIIRNGIPRLKVISCDRRLRTISNHLQGRQ